MADVVPATMTAGARTAEVLRHSQGTGTTLDITEPTNSSPYGFSQAQAQKLLKAVSEMQTVLINAGLMS
jgi:hypothetical protein